MRRLRKVTAAGEGINKGSLKPQGRFPGFFVLRHHHESPVVSQIKTLYAEKEMLLASNKSLAEYNLSQEPLLTEARVRLQERHREANRAAEQVRMARDKVNQRAGTVEPDTMLALLQES